MLSTIANGVEYRFFDHIYAVSKCGKFLRRLEPYTPCIRYDGYLSVGRQRLAHRVVATCWVDRPEGSNHVHHINHDKTDNRAENLMWVTPKQHIRDHHPEAAKGHKMSEEGKARLRALRLGSVTSEETKAKQRAASIRLGCRPPNATGRVVSEETRLKQSLTHHRKKSCTIFGVSYPSFTSAGKALGEKPLTLRKRCLSENFPDYQV